MTELFEQTMEPQRVTGSFHAHHRGSCERSIKRTHVVPLMIQRDLVLLPICGIHPTDGLGADMQIHSDVHCHLRLLSKPKPNDGRREYQLSPQGCACVMTSEGTGKPITPRQKMTLGLETARLLGFLC